MRIAVFGSGSVGGYSGGRLARAGLDVALLARSEHLRVMQGHGLLGESPGGDFTAHPVLATDDPAQVGPDTFVVALQNGVEA